MSNPAHGCKHSDEDGDFVMRSGANRAAQEDMQRAVVAGKKAIWPLFFATLFVGVGTSVWGLLKYKSDEETYFRWVFGVVLVGWAVLSGIEGFMLNELSTIRRTHHPKIVLRICFVFGGWFTGYLIASSIAVAVWMYQGHFTGGSGSHALGWGLLIVQVLLCAACIAGFVFYVVLYGRKIRKIPLQAEDPSKIRSVRRQVSDKGRAIGRKLSESSRRSKRSSRSSKASSTLVGGSSTRSKRSSSSTVAPADVQYGKDGKKSMDDGYSTDGGTSTGSENSLLADYAGSGYTDRARQPASTSAGPTSTTPRTSSSARNPLESSVAYAPTTASGAPIPASLRVGSPTNPPPSSPANRTSSAGNVPVVVKYGSQYTQAMFDPRADRYVSSSASTRPSTAASNNAYRPYRAPNAAAYSASSSESTYRAYSPSTSFSPSSSPAPTSYTAYSPPAAASVSSLSRSYTRSSPRAAAPGIGTRPPQSTSAPPASTSPYATPYATPYASYALGRASSLSPYTVPPRSTSPLRVLNSDPPANGRGASGGATPTFNPDALPPMPEYHR